MAVVSRHGKAMARPSPYTIGLNARAGRTKSEDMKRLIDARVKHDATLGQAQQIAQRRLAMLLAQVGRQGAVLVRRHRANEDLRVLRVEEYRITHS